MNIYVGNLSYDATDEDLKGLFEKFGEVESVNIIQDRYSNKSKGFAFVEMSDDEEGTKAIEELNNQEFMGRNIKVDKARPRNRGGSRRSKNF